MQTVAILSSNVGKIELLMFKVGKFLWLELLMKTALQHWNSLKFSDLKFSNFISDLPTSLLSKSTFPSQTHKYGIRSSNLEGSWSQRDMKPITYPCPNFRKNQNEPWTKYLAIFSILLKTHPTLQSTWFVEFPRQRV